MAHDPVRLELVKNAIGSVVDEMVLTVIRISETLSAARPSARAASLLGLAADTPALVIRRVAFTYDDQPVEYRVSWVNSEKHEYLSDLWRPPSGNSRAV